MKGYIDSVAGGINLTTCFIHKFPSHNGCIFHISQTIHCVLPSQYFLQNQNKNVILLSSVSFLVYYFSSPKSYNC